MSIINNSKIRVSELDFDSIKSNFKDYLRSQAEFADYDFEASGMTVLLDTLAYNTYYNSVLANFIANETFIDSAQKRDSVVSHAKSLGYRPKSVKAAKAKIQMILKNAVGSPNQLVMKAGTPFETTVREQTFQFVTLNDVVAQNDANEYNFGDFYVYQGQFQQNTFVASGTKAEKFTLPNPNVDSSSIRVIVQTSSTVLDYSYYSSADTIVDVLSDSKVFFTQEGINGKTDVYFGDGIIGKQLAAGNVVVVTYLTSDGQNANDAKVFKLTGTVEGNSVVTTTTIDAASGGADAEDIDSIRFNALTYFGVQNRAVTEGDYKSLILQNFQNAKNIITWGGEKQIPPEYGKVFICVQPKNVDYITTTEQQEIRDIVKKRSVANVAIKFVNPEYIDLELTSDVYYDSVKNDKNSVDLRTNIITDITTYAENYLGKFDAVFRYSQLSRIIDNSDYSILNNLTTFKVYKSFLPTISSQNFVSFNFYNKLNEENNSVSSTGFFVNGLEEKVYLRDYNGVMQLYYYDSSYGLKIHDSSVGTIDYKTGSIVLKPLLITGFDGSEIRIYVTPAINDITSMNNNIVRIKTKNITVNVIAETVGVR